MDALRYSPDTTVLPTAEAEAFNGEDFLREHNLERFIGKTIIGHGQEMALSVALERCPELVTDLEGTLADYKEAELPKEMVVTLIDKKINRWSTQSEAVELPPDAKKNRKIRRSR